MLGGVIWLIYIDNINICDEESTAVGCEIAGAWGFSNFVNIVSCFGVMVVESK